MLSNSFLQEPYDSLWHTTQGVIDCFLTHFFEQILHELFQICQKFKAFTPSNMHFTLNHFMRFPLTPLHPNISMQVLHVLFSIHFLRYLQGEFV